MKIHILGICGTFMGGMALLARAQGHEVSGQDAGVYPPMSSQLAEQGITLHEGYGPEAIPEDVDMVVIGNALSRGNPAVEQVLNRGLPYTSGAQWLSDNFLQGKWVLAVAGTHGKTTTAAMLAWILEYAGMKPGFLIGGIPQNFGLSARPGESPFFVVEADEYDTAFFDKRSKFVHYRPRTLVLNNLEFDHADIFDDLAAIQRQFHHLVRTVPEQGLILAPQHDANLDAVLRQGCWTPVETFGGSKGWLARNGSRDGSRFDVYFVEEKQGTVAWGLLGQHNVNNALAAIGAARHSGVPAAQAIHALCEFENVKRRMELRGEVNGIRVYDDFAHHPTAIATTLAGLRNKVGTARIIAVLEPRSNTMKMGVHKETLLPSLQEADRVFIYTPQGLGWSLPAAAPASVSVCSDFEQLLSAVLAEARAGDHLLVMSNGGFNGIHGKLLQGLQGVDG
ncbi:MAG: UDP-N-acetylmuramate:L-alanyl-gamma-D-glutamyl-meso-diaminopimelate ligase [Gammaproteobacteria bacterium]|nr:UDP-N-acetylmuramate:L-alanyl-gamma-D-glutamyl-meso-diaminopimelate ligase [Gammaproteobacteria bacterium]